MHFCNLWPFLEQRSKKESMPANHYSGLVWKVFHNDKTILFLGKPARQFFSKPVLKPIFTEEEARVRINLFVFECLSQIPDFPWKRHHQLKSYFSKKSWGTLEAKRLWSANPLHMWFQAVCLLKSVIIVWNTSLVMIILCKFVPNVTWYAIVAPNASKRLGTPIMPKNVPIWLCLSPLFCQTSWGS